uniref:EF-hand domain-containing protein n=1 Tax=Percolomonas cosmopolitus TaxID=63605 RepID=A0A6U0JK25_9EUKA|mmetsp:Transcript_10186/g.37876  ORF Transcript_10186/g.37876 Transcript_10186/m.37876 type:complete len:349 (+) Transcript_10186:823-1869(+)|eukprot:CAMPEP_0117441710 /NCGR_PEP_ID=MMETSP0759-20121206/3773_1 /TAXON_ID=63605 /ORGANISM="Percolomonas cosmopolitus, Strain WS" /LENGTH=348 /DNA_ID=CAMNT_0005233569 /DNA_START=1073 /DNA_END=2119 /DNA_ORIENTATION=+
MSFRHSQQSKHLSLSSTGTKSKLESLSQDELSIYQATFDLYANPDGLIVANDLYALLHALGQHISQRETEALIHEINGTDKITFENFCTFLMDDEEDEDDVDSFGVFDTPSTTGSCTDSPFDKNYKVKNGSYQDLRLSSSHQATSRNSFNGAASRKHTLKKSSSWGSHSHPVLIHHAARSMGGGGVSSTHGNTKRFSQHSSDFASDSISDVLSSFSSSSSLNDMRNSSFNNSNGASTPVSTPSSACNSKKRPQMRRETTIYGSQLLKHPIRIENDAMKTFVRQTHDLQDIFGSLPKNSQGKVKSTDLKRALLSLNVPNDDKAMKILEKKDSMDLKQFITFFQLNVDQR